MEGHQIDPQALAHAKLAIAALCGGIVRLFLRPATSFLRTGWALFACVTCGFYGTPAMMHYLQLTPDSDFIGAMGAALGFIGLSVAERILRAADGLDLKSWLMAWLGPKSEEK